MAKTSNAELTGNRIAGKNISEGTNIYVQDIEDGGEDFKVLRPGSNFNPKPILVPRESSEEYIEGKGLEFIESISKSNLKLDLNIKSDDKKSHLINNDEYKVWNRFCC